MKSDPQDLQDLLNELMIDRLRNGNQTATDVERYEVHVMGCQFGKKTRLQLKNLPLPGVWRVLVVNVYGLGLFPGGADTHSLLPPPEKVAEFFFKTIQQRLVAGATVREESLS
jgi:hypothetical protein